MFVLLFRQFEVLLVTANLLLKFFHIRFRAVELTSNFYYFSFSICQYFGQIRKFFAKFAGLLALILQ